MRAQENVVDEASGADVGGDGHECRLRSPLDGFERIGIDDLEIVQTDSWLLRNDFPSRGDQP